MDAAQDAPPDDEVAYRPSRRGPRPRRSANMSTTNRQGVEISEGPGCHDEECIYKIVFVVAGGLALMT